MYGTRSQAAGREIFAKAMIVARMASQRKIISVNAPPGECDPKKIIDQQVFKISWMMNAPRAIFEFLFLNPFFQMRNRAMPMSTNSVVQTGANIQFGGAICGLAR